MKTIKEVPLGLLLQMIIIVIDLGQDFTLKAQECIDYVYELIRFFYREGVAYVEPTA